MTRVHELLKNIVYSVVLITVAAVFFYFFFFLIFIYFVIYRFPPNCYCCYFVVGAFGSVFDSRGVIDTFIR